VSRPTFLFIPKFILNLVLGEMSDVLLNSAKVLPKKAGDTGYQFEYPELEKTLPSLCNQLAHDWVIEQWVPATAEEVFAFFMDKKEMEKISAPWLNFRVMSQSEDPIKEGTCLNYRFKVRGLPMCWQSMIINWKKNESFTDIQIAGPYATWTHIHDFIEKDGGTIIRERAIYMVPFCVPGDVVIHPFVRHDLEKIFTHRGKKIAEHFRAAN
jgi:ligand-binding SRPBCC domain-containing protein